MTKRCAIYTRISTAGQEDGSSLDVQEAACRLHFATMGYEQAGVYSDVHSGADLWHRPRLQAMLEDAAAGRFDIVLVHHTDRLSREPEHLAFIRVQLKRAGVVVESVTNPRTDSFEDQLMATFEGLFAKHERVRIQGRMAAGRKHRAEVEGRLQVGGHALFGYRYDQPEVGAKNAYVEEPAQSWLVKRIYREAAEGKSLRSIAAGLNEAGILSPKGKAWHGRQISRLLANPAYRGVFLANRHRVTKQGGRKVETMRPEADCFEIPGVVPALVDEATWRRANERLERNRIEHTRPYDEAEDALLRAGFVFCATCGNRMFVQRRRGKISYKCQTAYYDNGSTCRGWSVEAGKLDLFVWNRVMGWLGDPGFMLFEARRSRPSIEAGMAVDLSAFDATLARIEAEQAGISRRLGLMDDHAAEPAMARLSELGRERAALLAERAEAERKLEAVKAAGQMVEDVWAEIERYAETIDDWTYGQKRELLQRMGIRVTIDKHGSGRYGFVLDVAPPWPEGTGWWEKPGGLFPPMQPTEAWEVAGGALAVTDLSKSVYAAYQRTQTLSAEQERKIDRS